MAELVALLIIYYAMRHAVSDTKAAWGRSRSAYMARASARHPGMPKRGRVGHAIRHDIGYLASQLMRGAPTTRHGFAAGWHEGSMKYEQAKAARCKAKADRLETRAKLAPQVREHNRRAAAAKEQIKAAKTGQAARDGFPVILTARSKSGRPVNPVTGAPEDSVTVWDQEDLDRRLDAADADPDIEVTTRPVPTGPVPTGDGAEEDASEATGDEPGGTTTQEPSTEGSEPMAAGTAGDVNYTEHLGAYTKVSELAEEYAGDKRLTEMQGILSQVDGTGLDKDSLSDAAEVDEALSAVQEAVQKLSEVASSAQQGLQQRHGGINEAVQDSPVDKPADADYYTNA